MEENQIRIVYRDFDELIKENRGLFKYFKKSKNPGLIKAIWNARGAEISFLKERLESVEKSNHKRLSWLRSLKELQSKYKDLIEGLTELKVKFKKIKKENELNKAEFIRYKKYSKSLEFALNTTTGEKVDEQTQKESLTTQLTMVNKALLETDKENLQLHLKIKELEEQIFDLQDELKVEKGKTKQHMRINKSMENELFRLNHEKDIRQFLN